MVETENAGIGFAAVGAAGGSTAVGAAVVFFPRLVKLASRRVLASSLGFSAGVMTYVSFVEIFQKSVGAYNDDLLAEGRSEDKAEGLANTFATLSFFAGAAVMVLLDVLIEKLTGVNHGRPELVDGSGVPGDARNDGEEVVVPHCIGCTENPVAELASWQRQADEDIANEVAEQENQTTTILSGNSAEVSGDKNDSSSDGDGRVQHDHQEFQVETAGTDLENEKEKEKLIHMGLSTAVAIALHNFPEGLATFIAVLDDPKVGAILAIAIAIHNIPEGLCVALPVYYATGKRWKAFCWGALSGISEPIAALFGWVVFASAVSDIVYGLMFGLVAGMMVVISFRELLPTAHRFDPGDTVVTYSTIVGMIVMAMSLVLYQL